MATGAGEAKTEIEFAVRCMTQKGSIFVRVQKDGKWGSYALSELSEREQAEWITRWWSEGRR